MFLKKKKNFFKTGANCPLGGDFSKLGAIISKGAKGGQLKNVWEL